MKKVSIILCAIIVLVTTISRGNQQEVKNNDTAAVSQDSLIKMGEYLVNAIGCDDCHSPKLMGPRGPEVDMSKRFSGHPANMPLAKVSREQLKSYMLFNPMLTAFVGPWGASYSANISSDATGIGSWTEQQFFKAIREGKAKGVDGGRMLLPPMPWPNFAKLKDQDIRAMFAYLKSTKPVENVVPAPLAPNQLPVY
jgi:cytochrome c2